MICVVVDRKVDEGAEYVVEVGGANVARFTSEVTRPVFVSMLTDQTLALHEVDEGWRGAINNVAFGVAADATPDKWKRADWPTLLALPAGSYYLRHDRGRFVLVLGEVAE